MDANNSPHGNIRDLDLIEIEIPNLKSTASEIVNQMKLKKKEFYAKVNKNPTIYKILIAFICINIGIFVLVVYKFSTMSCTVICITFSS